MQAAEPDEGDTPSKSECVKVLVRPRQLPRGREADVVRESPAPTQPSSRSASRASLTCAFPSPSQAVAVNEAENSLRVSTKAKSATQADSNFECGFDVVFPDSVSQEGVYAAVKDRILAVTQGVNCTVFAYGQTGTGTE